MTFFLFLDNRENTYLNFSHKANAINHANQRGDISRCTADIKHRKSNKEN